MNEEKIPVEQEEIINLARRTQRYCDLLAEQCDSWQDPPNVDAVIDREEGNSSIFRLKKGETLI